MRRMLKGYLYNFPSLALMVAITTSTAAAMATNHTINAPIMVIKSPITSIIRVI